MHVQVGLHVEIALSDKEREAANDRIKSMGQGRGLKGTGLTEAQAAALAEVRWGVWRRVMDAYQPTPSTV